MEEATKLRESATDVAEAMSEIEGYMQRLKDMAIEVRSWYFTVHILWVTFILSYIMVVLGHKIWAKRREFYQGHKAREFSSMFFLLVLLQTF